MWGRANTVDTIDTTRIPAIAADDSLYPVEKMDAHRRGLLHQAVSVFVFDSIGRLLIQRRAAGKYHCPGLWANSCCSHPHFGEASDRAATRRLGEELGLELPLTQTATTEYRAEVGNDLIEHERVAVFRGTLPVDAGPPAPNPAEVSEIAWLAPEDLKRMARNLPGRFTPWLRIYLQRWDRLALG